MSRGWSVGWIALALALALLPGASAAQLITPEELASLKQLKSFIYTGFTRVHAEDVAARSAQPAVYREVGGAGVPVTYYHFRIPTERVRSVAASGALPPGFSLAPVRILSLARPDHYLSLAVYRAGGEAPGLRAEWMTYGRTAGDPKPRVLMLEVQTGEGGLDPVDGLTPPAERFEHGVAGGRVTTEIASGDSRFSASFAVPEGEGLPLLDPSWEAAGDVVYWSNGVADLRNVNGLRSSRPVVPVRPGELTLRNDTRWAAFVEPRPRWVLVAWDRIDEIVQPWVNLDDPDLPLDPARRAELLATKARLFSANELERADAIGEGRAEPVADFLVKDGPPSIFLNFEIDPERRAELGAAIPLPEGFELAPMRTLRGARPRYLLSLNVYETVGIASGLRAEWSVYVTRRGDPVPRYMIVEAQSDSFSLDPVNRFTLPADRFAYELVDGVLEFEVREAGSFFQARIPIPEAPRRRSPTLEWAEANDLIYWRNGVADKAYYSGLVYDVEMLQVPARAVTIRDRTAWAPYLRLAEVLVFENRLEFIVSPWSNLDELERELRATARGD